MTIHEWRQVPPLRKQAPKINGGRCGYPNGRRADGLCGRETQVAYVRRFGPGVAWRCTAHDRPEVARAAAAEGWDRVEVSL